MKKRGFTLIELTAVLAIMSIIGIAAFNVFTTYIRLESDLDAKLSIQRSFDAFRKSIFADIRKAYNTKEAELVSGSGQFTGDNMQYNNDYCRMKGYKPLIYMDKLDNAKTFYAYDTQEKEIRRVSYPINSSTVTTKKYFPTELDLTTLSKGNKWDSIDEANIAATLIGTTKINEEIMFKGLSITDSNGHRYNSFTKLGDFIKKDNRGVVIGEYVILKSRNLDPDNKYPCFIVLLRSENFIYYSNIIDELISSHIGNSTGNGIEVIVNSGFFSSGNVGKYYDIKLIGSKARVTKETKIRISTIDYGGDID